MSSMTVPLLSLTGEMSPVMTVSQRKAAAVIASLIACDTPAAKSRVMSKAPFCRSVV
jgi:hypothetical protein